MNEVKGRIKRRICWYEGMFYLFFEIRNLIDRGRKMNDKRYDDGAKVAEEITKITLERIVCSG